MALGYCASCGKFCAITPRKNRFGDRMQDWFPIAHRILAPEGDDVDVDLLPWCDGKDVAIR